MKNIKKEINYIYFCILFLSIGLCVTTWKSATSYDCKDRYNILVSEIRYLEADVHKLKKESEKQKEFIKKFLDGLKSESLSILEENSTVSEILRIRTDFLDEKVQKIEMILNK